LIVTCPNCAARFDLDASRVPAAGTQVRCSQCEKVFFLDAPSAPAGVSDAARDDADGGEIAWAEGDEVNFEGLAEPEADGETSDVREDSAASASDADESEELLEATPLEEDDFSELALPGEDPDSESTDSEDLVEGDDWALLDEEGDAASGGPVEEGKAPPAAPGSPESSALAPAKQVAIGSIALKAVPAGSHRDHGVRAPTSWGLRKRFSAMGRGIGWGLSAVLVLLALTTTVRETADSLRSVTQSVDVGPLRAEGLRGEWVDTMAGRTLLAVTGELHNPSGSAEILGAVLEVSLVGSDGRRLVWPAAPLGLRIPENEIRELPPQALESSQDRAALELATMKLAPGQSVPVQAIFLRPPDDAVRFALDLGPAVLRPVLD
jgi:predicted Zn finger-like uncharacterized protein